MSRDNYDPFTGQFIEHDPQLPAWRPLNTKPELERGTINPEREKQIIGLPRYVEGAAEAAEAPRAPIIKP